METITISGRYKILSELGKGGFGQTFLAEDLHLPTKPKCVVKQLKPDFTDESSLQIARRLFEQEAEVLYRLGSHPFIPNLLAHFEENGEFYLVQELVEGYTLAQILASGRKFNELETVELLGQILDILTFVHIQNVIHRDIKPSNIIQNSSNGRFYLIDFGAVKQVKKSFQNQDSSFHSTIAIGSEGYMPGEQIAGKPRFSSDLYALGLVGVEVLTGLHPLRLPQNQNSGEFTWQYKVMLRPEVEKFISKNIRYDFRQRYNSASEAFAALKIIVASAGFTQKNKAMMPPGIEAPRPPQETIYVPSPPPTPTLPLPTQASPGQPNTTPTMVAAPPRQNYQTYSRVNNSSSPNGVIEKFWKNDFAIGALVSICVLAIFFVGGYTLVSLAGSNNNLPGMSERTNPFPDDQNALTKIKPGSAFQEATKQADEAAAKEKKATTQFDWQEIGNQWKCASTLLAAIEPASPDYLDAQKKMPEYQQNSETAFKKAQEIAINPNSNTSATPQTTPPFNSSYPTSSSSPVVAASPAFKMAKMPGARSGRMYIAYSSSQGDYIGGGQDKVITSNDGDFTARVTRGQVTVHFNGGSDWWDVDFAAPRDVPLVPGSYTGAQRCAFHSPTRPGFDFGGSGRGCNKLSANFNINQIIYSTDQENVIYLDATFMQRCEEMGPPLMGRVHYDAR